MLFKDDTCVEKKASKGIYKIHNTEILATFKLSNLSTQAEARAMFNTDFNPSENGWRRLRGRPRTR
jgi:hypothetical protein